MKKILTTTTLTLLCVVSFVCIKAINNGQNDIFTHHVSKSTTVYVTPTGKCYHYSRSCAGKNAMATTLDKCKDKRPCKKCVK